LAKDEAASLAQLGSAKTREQMTEDAAQRAVPHLPGIHELKTAIAARLGVSEDNLQRYAELMDASDAVVDLVRSAKLDAAEVAARDLLARFPDQPDGWDRLGMVYEARVENQKAAEGQAQVFRAATTSEIDLVFADLARDRVDALLLQHLDHQLPQWVRSRRLRDRHHSGSTGRAAGASESGGCRPTRRKLSTRT
jgi:hypothetical protein